MDKDKIDLAAMILLIIGGLNWGLVGLLNFNVVTWLLGTIPMLVTVAYALIGLSGLWKIYYMYQQR